MLKHNAANSTPSFSYDYTACFSFNRLNPTCNKSAAFSTRRLFYTIFVLLPYLAMVLCLTKHTLVSV